MQFNEAMSFAENTALEAVDLDGFYTVGEFAAKVRVEPATIYAAIAAGEIEGVIRIGTRRGYRIPRASYAPYIRSRLVTPAAA